METKCNVCGGKLIKKEGIYQCINCDALFTLPSTPEEAQLLVISYEILRKGEFDEAEESFDSLLKKYPYNHEAHWGKALAKHGIIFVDDLIENKKVPTCFSISINKFLEDDNYKKALEYAPNEIKKSYIELGNKIELIKEEWLDKARKEKPYDIFICYKESELDKGINRTEDSIAVLELYTHLMNKGYKVFFSRESLRDKISERFEPYIYNAILTSKVMILYGSKKEYFESTWIKNEWSRYLKRLKNNEKQSNSLVVVIDKEMKIENLPLNLKTQQCLDANKRTFYFDLDKHIDKIISIERRNIPVIETIDIKPIKKQTNKQIIKEQLETYELKDKIVTKNKKALNKQAIQKVEIGMFDASNFTGKKNYFVSGKKFLENGMFENAIQAFSESLKNNPNNAEALWFKLLASLEVRTTSELINDYKKFNNLDDIENIMKYASKELGQEIIETLSNISLGNIKNKRFDYGILIFETIIKYNIEGREKIVDDHIQLSYEYINIDISISEKILDSALKAFDEKDADKYIEVLDTYINKTIELNFWKIAKKYCDKLIEVDAHNEGVLLKKLCIDIESRGLSSTSYLKIPDKYLDKINDYIVNSSKEQAFIIINAIYESIIKAIKENQLIEEVKLGRILSLVQLIFKYNFEKRNVFLDNLLEEIENSNQLGKYEGFSELVIYLFKCTDEQRIKEYIQKIETIAKKILINGFFREALDLYKYLESLDPNSSKYIWLKLMALYERDILKFEDFESFERILGLCEKEVYLKYIELVIGMCVKKFTKKIDDNKANKLIKKFDRFISYIPKDETKLLIQKVNLFADALKVNRFYKEAIKYYQISLSIDNVQHEIHWSLLQAKNKAFDDKKLLKSKKDITKTQEFNNAVLSSNDESIVEKYIEISKKQKTYCYNLDNKKLIFFLVIVLAIVVITLASSYIRYLNYANSQNIWFVCLFLIVIVGIIILNLKRISVFKKENRKKGIMFFYISVIISIISLLVFIYVPVYNTNNYTYDELNYIYEDNGNNEYTLVRYEGKEKNIIIPSKVDGKDVVAIGVNVFKNNSFIESITIPSSVTSINDSTFMGCSSLIEMTLPFVGASRTSTGASALFGYIFGTTPYTGGSSTKQYYSSSSSITYYIPTSLKTVIVTDATTLGYGVFFGCSSLTSITIPEGVTSIGTYAFSGCSSLTSITIPSSVTSIGTYAFSGCSSLTSITIQEGVTTIGYGAFAACTSLTSITVPDSVISISSSAFSGCSSLIELTLPFVGASRTATGASALFGYIFGITSYIGGSSTIQYYASSSYRTYYIPESLKTVIITDATTLEDSAFYNCSSLTSITIPEGVTIIGSYAFYGCSSLTSISLPFVGASRTATGTSALFGYIFGTTSYTGGSSTIQYYTSSSSSTYYIPTSLRTVIITDATTIGYGAFYDCSSLTSIAIPSSVTSIGYEAFYSCSGLTSITIPSSVTSIGDDAFRDCSRLTIYAEASSKPAGWSSYWNPYNRPVVWGHISNGITAEGLKYGISHIEDEGLVVIVGYIGEETEVHIPETIEGINVKRIADNAFYGCSGLTSITIPEGVTIIGSFDFRGCSSLTSITIPSSVTIIGDNAFSGFSSLTSITIPSSVTSIGDNAFYGCSSLTSITIPSSVTSIGEHAFSGCSSLTSITISSSVTSIGEAAFRDCSSLTSITIPSSVTSIGEAAFRDCSSLTSIVIPTSVTSIGTGAFYGCSGLTSITIPSSVTSIGDLAFYGCSSLTSITIPSSVTSIDNSAFSGCSGLTSVVIPNSVTSIGTSAFSGCSGLTSITIPSSVTSIGNYAISGCSSLTSISLPFVGASRTATGTSALFGYIFGTTPYTGGSSTKQYYSSSSSITYYIPTSLKTVIITDATTIGYGAFAACTSLTSITIPEGVTSIGTSAFSGCSSLTSITIPEGVTSIGTSAFSGCSSLTSISLPFVGASRTATGTSALFGYIFGTTPYTGGSSTIQYYTSSSSITYYIPASLKTVIITDATTIGYGAFAACTSLTSITIPEGVTSIDDFTFYNCSSLTSITISSSVTSIGTYAFSGCSSLTSITIPSSVTSIGEAAFRDCSSLTSIVIPTSVTSIGSDAFYGCSGLTSITIPSSVTSIGDLAFYGCSSLTSITIPSSVTSIGTYAFSGCSSLTSITIPEGVTSIGTGAFYGCSSLTSITIPSSVTSIGDNAFYGCSSLTSIVIPTSVTSIGSDAFYGCSGLTSITIPSSVTSIGTGAFYGCSGLTSITIPSSVTSIGDNAFYGCSSLTSITIPSSVTSIGDNAFSGCSSLTSITIPSSVTSIGDNAFYGCSSLTSITIQEGVTTIGYGAFAACTSLTSITVPDSVISISLSAFSGCSSLTSISLPFVGASRTATGTSALFGYIFGTTPYTGGSSTKQYYSSSSSITYYIPTSLKTVIVTDATTLGYGVFFGCSSLISITIPEGVTSIGDFTFYNCSSLTSITIPSSVTNIGERAFYDCSSLTSIVIPIGVTSIGYTPFYGCSSLTIYAEAASEPSGWDSSWNPNNIPVVWGYTGE